MPLKFIFIDVFEDHLTKNSRKTVLAFWIWKDTILEKVV